MWIEPSTSEYVSAEQRAMTRMLIEKIRSQLLSSNDPLALKVSNKDVPTPDLTQEKENRNGD